MKERWAVTKYHLKCYAIIHTLTTLLPGHQEESERYRKGQGQALSFNRVPPMSYFLQLAFAFKEMIQLAIHP